MAAPSAPRGGTSSASAANGTVTNPTPRTPQLRPSSHWSQPSPSRRRAASSSLSIVTSGICYDNSRSWCWPCNSWPEPGSRRPQRPQQRRTRRQVRGIRRIARKKEGKGLGGRTKPSVCHVINYETGPERFAGTTRAGTGSVRDGVHARGCVAWQRVEPRHGGARGMGANGAHASLSVYHLH